MPDPQSGVKAQLLSSFNRLFGGATLARLDVKGCQRGVVFFKVLCDRVIGRDADKRRP